ncbi:MAG: helix-turn-helix domain-containing protein [Bacteroidota bacterium]
MHLLKLVKILKERREALNVTQEGLAELSGVGLRTLKQLESGKGNPTLSTIHKISDVLGMEFCLRIKEVMHTK